ncbi:MAG: oligopeptide:H+ symporter [Burkholderiales bacterium]|nr:oligopeptide:H+ symporter [Burkholderiales bacterium]
MSQSKFYKQPFFVLCFLEFFERFGYYGFNYISIYFYISKLGFSEATATTLSGGFAALTYTFNAVGGYVADNVLGIKRTMFTGAFFLCIGYAFLALGTDINPQFVYTALTFIIIGSCLFKPAPTNLIASIYGHNPKLLDSTYTLFYMSINMGSFCTSLITPYLAKTYGYTPALLLCASGVVIGILYNIINYKSIRDIDNKTGHATLNIKKLSPFIFSLVAGFIFIMTMLQNDHFINQLLIVVSIAIFGTFIFQIFREKDRAQRQKMIVAVVLLLYAVVFFVIYQQKNTSFMLFNKHHVNLHVLGFDINPQTVPGLLGTAGLVILSPLFANMYRKLGDRDLALPFKFAVGLTFSACAYGLLYLVCAFTDPTQKISFAWEILAISVFFASSELLISALGVSLMAQLMPERMRGFAMGTWFITSALGLKLGTYIASLVANTKKVSVDAVYSTADQIASFHSYEYLFRNIFLAGITAAIIAFILGSKLKKMLG